MEDSLHAAHAAFRQRFRDLATQFQQNHRAWQEAVRVGNVPLQSALVTRERAILTEVQEVMAAYQATIAQRHRERDAAREPAAGGDEGDIGRTTPQTSHQ